MLGLKLIYVSERSSRGYGVRSHHRLGVGKGQHFVHDENPAAYYISDTRLVICIWTRPKYSPAIWGRSMSCPVFVVRSMCCTYPFPTLCNIASYIYNTYTCYIVWYQECPIQCLLFQIFFCDVPQYSVWYMNSSANRKLYIVQWHIQ